MIMHSEEQTPQLVTIENDIPLTDSRKVAQELGIEHGDFFSNLITKYQDEIEADFSLIRFENGAVKIPGQRGTKHVRYALLTEDQTYAYLAYSRNTEQARTCKRKLVKAFSEARKKIQRLEDYINVRLFSPQVLREQKAHADWKASRAEEGDTERTELLFDLWRHECSQVNQQDWQAWDEAIKALIHQQQPLLLTQSSQEVLSSGEAV